MIVTRHPSAQSFLEVAQPLLMRSEAENNLIIGIAQGLARNPTAAKDPYLATVANSAGVHAAAVYIAPFKLVITRANREPIVALAHDVLEAVPNVEGITGPDRSAADFAMTWNKLTGVHPTLGMRLRIHETRGVAESGLPSPSGHFRAANSGDHDVLTAWTETFVTEAKIPEKVDTAMVAGDAIRRGRLHVWDDGKPVSMAAWSGKTPSGVRINFVYTPRELRGKGYATACVSALTRQLLKEGNSFCWLYTNLSTATSPNIFLRIGYRPVSDVSEYYLRE